MATDHTHHTAGSGRRRYLPSAKRKREILDAAFIEFSGHGYAATSLEAIASRAGMSKAGIYAHYPSKEEVFEDLLVTMLSPPERMQVTFDAEVSLESIVDAYLAMCYATLENPVTMATFRLLVMESRRIAPELIQRWHQRVVEANLAQDQAVFDECIRRGIMRDGVLRQSSWLAGSPLAYWLCQYLLFAGKPPVPLAQVRQMHRRMLLELLEPRPST